MNALFMVLVILSILSMPSALAGICGGRFDMPVVESKEAPGQIAQVSNNAEMANKLVAAARDGKLDAVNFFLEVNVDPNVVNNHNDTALSWAAQKGHPEIALALIAAKADVEQPNGKGLHPLYAAAARGGAAVTALLLENKAQVLAKTSEGSSHTALHGAASQNRLDVAQLLIEAKSDLEAITVDGRTPILQAAAMWQQQTAILLLNAKADPTKLMNDGESILDLCMQKNLPNLAAQCLYALSDSLDDVQLQALTKLGHKNEHGQLVHDIYEIRLGRQKALVLAKISDQFAGHFDGAVLTLIMAYWTWDEENL